MRFSSLNALTLPVFARVRVATELPIPIPPRTTCDYYLLLYLFGDQPSAHLVVLTGLEEGDLAALQLASSGHVLKHNDLTERQMQTTVKFVDLGLSIYELCRTVFLATLPSPH
jgi:hypothetical protein